MEHPKFKLSVKQTEAIELLEDETTNELFFGGGAGGGKSIFGCYWHIKRRLKYPKTRGLIGRAKLSTLLDSTFVTFLKMCEILQLKQGVHFKYNAKSQKVIWFNGSVTILKDLFFYPSDPEFNSLGSTEYTDVFVDEAPEITQKAFDILNSRIRWMLTDYKLAPKALLTGNPSESWVKETYVKRKGVFINLPIHQKRVLATVADNPDRAFVDNYTKQLNKMHSDYDKDRLLHGDWDAMPRTGKEFYHQFDPKVNVRENQYNPRIPLHISYDFNYHPYMTLLVYQIEEVGQKYVVNGLFEMCFAHPRNSTKEITLALVEWLITLPRNSLFFYGDYTGMNRTPMGLEYREEMMDHQFAIVEIILRDLGWVVEDRVIPNPPPAKRRDFVMDILTGVLDIEFYIDPDMEHTKADFMHMKQGPDGLKLKQVVKDTDTKASYELYGHTSDATEYFLCSAFNNLFQRYGTRR